MSVSIFTPKAFSMRSAMSIPCCERRRAASVLAALCNKDLLVLPHKLKEHVFLWVGKSGKWIQDVHGFGHGIAHVAP
jgi:hypothetical protein